MSFPGIQTLFKTAGRRQKQSRSFSNLVADVARVLHGHHQVSRQEVDQDVGDICAQGLQDVLSNVDLGFICTIKEFPLSVCILTHTLNPIELQQLID